MSDGRDYSLTRAGAIRGARASVALAMASAVLGAGFGLLRGGVLLLALSTVVALTPSEMLSARSPNHQVNLNVWLWRSRFCHDCEPRREAW